MRSTRRIERVSTLLVTVTVTLAATVVVSAASAANQQMSEIPYLSHGVGVTTPTFEPIVSPAQQFGGTAELPAASSEGAGAVTPTDLARAVVPRELEDSTLVRNDRRIERDLRGHEPTVVASAASERELDVSHGVLGFALGLALTAALAGLLAMSRRRLRIAHS